MLEYFNECRRMCEQLTERPLADGAGVVTVLKRFGVKKPLLGKQIVCHRVSVFPWVCF